MATDGHRLALARAELSERAGVSLSMTRQLKQPEPKRTSAARRKPLARLEVEPLEAALRARTEAEAAERRAAFLAEASRVLASSLDYETTLATVARLAVPYLADWCAVDIPNGDTSIHRLAIAHVDPAKAELALELLHRCTQDPANPNPIMKVLRTGHPEIYPEFPDPSLVALAHDAEHLRIARDLGCVSVLIVPLLTRGRTLGTMTFVTGESGRRYGQSDLALAEDLARRAGLAVENARLYREAQGADRRKDEFLAMLAHELRNPLAPIMNALQVLDRIRTPE